MTQHPGRPETRYLRQHPPKPPRFEMTRALARAIRLRQLAEWGAVAEIVAEAKGDPRLSWWEASFIQTVENWIKAAQTDWQLTSKQIAKLNEIAVKVRPPLDLDALEAAPPPDQAELSAADWAG